MWHLRNAHRATHAIPWVLDPSFWLSCMFTVAWHYSNSGNCNITRHVIRVACGFEMPRTGQRDTVRHFFQETAVRQDLQALICVTWLEPRSVGWKETCWLSCEQIKPLFGFLGSKIIQQSAAKCSGQFEDPNPKRNCLGSIKHIRQSLFGVSSGCKHYVKDAKNIHRQAPPEALHLINTVPLVQDKKHVIIMLWSEEITSPSSARFYWPSWHHPAGHPAEPWSERPANFNAKAASSDLNMPSVLQRLLCIAA